SFHSHRPECAVPHLIGTDDKTGTSAFSASSAVIPNRPLNCHSLFSLFQSNLLIGEVTGWVWCPNIAGDCFRPDPEIPAADVQPTAPGTTPLHVFFLLFELHQEFIGRIGPNLTERALPDIPKAVMPPELISVNRAIPGDTSDTSAGIVPLIHLKELQDSRGSLRIFPCKTHISVRTVGMIVHSEHFH